VKPTPPKDTPAKSPAAAPTSKESKPAPTESKVSGSKASSSKKSAPAPVAPIARKRIIPRKRPMMPHLAPLPIRAASPSNAVSAKKLTPTFLKSQRQKLLDLRDALVDQMNGVARDSLGRGEDSSDSSAFGMHQADAGSDAYDRDFALSILSQEQDALHEIEEALQRIDSEEYGICQGSGDVIPQARLEAMPFARCTVDYQEMLDAEQSSGRSRAAVTSLFGLDEKETEGTAEEDE
jgi:RNA polymerase-binding transcription factor DksA